MFTPSEAEKVEPPYQRLVWIMVGIGADRSTSGYPGKVPAAHRHVNLLCSALVTLRMVVSADLTGRLRLPDATPRPADPAPCLDHDPARCGTKRPNG
jgi:hypothetical protein